MNKEVVCLRIRGGRIVDPGRGIDRVGDLLVAEGRIVQIGDTVPDGPSIAALVSKAKNLDAAGLVVCPGFVDLHCHLREPGFEYKETIATGTKAAAVGGFGAVCCMANTQPPLDAVTAVDWLKERTGRDSLITVLPIGCVSAGRKGEELTDMAELAEAGVVAFSEDGDPVASSQLMRRAMECSRNLGLPIIDHCEDKALSNGGVINEGRMSVETGLKGIPAVAEEVMLARDLVLARATGARVHIAHVSTAGSVELIRHAKHEGTSVTAEVTPHHLTLTEERIMGESSDKPFDTNAKVNPPLRTKADVEALIEGLRDDVIDAVATDHAPHSLADKDCEMEVAAFGISGFETAFGCLMDLVHREKITLTRLLSKLTCEPAKIIGRNGELGTLELGALANITILDPDREWIVDSRKFASKGKNTPYDGCRFKGKVMATIANGAVVYMDNGLEHRFDSTSFHSEPTPCRPERSEESYGW
ncbi:MAG: dihydroorotase [Dehalococcoidia bacterium]